MCCTGGTILIRDVPFTSVHFPDEVHRGNFSNILETDIATFQTILGEDGVVQDSKTLEVHNVDCYRSFKGQSKVLLLPKTTSEVSSILKYCNQRLLAVTPQGGNTGLVGGSVPVLDEIILSTTRMNTIHGLDEVSGILKSQAGVTLRSLNEFAKDYGYIVPLDLAPDEYCQIGGNIATNAGGLRFFRYGSLHANVAGLEVVLADGTILNMMKCMKKDNTGYDLKQLMIGSEGTLGVITQVALQCRRKPVVSACIFVGLKTFEEVITVFRTAEAHFRESLTCCELMDRDAMNCVLRNTTLKNPIAGEFEYFVLLEISGNDADISIEQSISKYLKSAPIGHFTSVTALSSKEIANVWELRRSIGLAVTSDGYAFKYDFSIPLETIPKFLEDVRKRVDGKALNCICFGHIGDSNIHLVVTTEVYSKEVRDLLEPFVYEWVGNAGGSISAEHGIGFKERKYLKHSKSPEHIEIMKRIKIAFDPKGILNPYKIFLD